VGITRRASTMARGPAIQCASSGRPSPAIQRGPDGMYVYIIKPDSTVAMQPVTVTEMSNGTSVVQKGLDAGTRIVVSGQYRLQPGSLVQSGAATAANSGGS